MAEADWRTLVTGWFPDLCDSGLRQMSWPRIEPHRDYIAAQLKAGVTAATIQPASRRRARVGRERGESAPVGAGQPARGRPPGPGHGAVRHRGARLRGADRLREVGDVVDPRSGRRRTVWAFVMVLCCSRHMFVRPTLIMDQAEWTTAHVEAFAFFGGVPARLVPDNLRLGWTGPTSTTRRSTGRMRSWPRTTAPSSTRPARSNPRTNRRSNGRCPTSGTRSGGAGSSPRSRRCAPPRWPGAARWPATGRVAHWTGRPRPQCSPRSSSGAGPVASGAVRAGHLVEREDRPGHPRQGRRHPLLAAVALPRRTRRRPVHDHHGAVLPPRRADQDPSASRNGASRPTTATTRRRRSPSTCAPRPGADAGPPRSARHAPR